MTDQLVNQSIKDLADCLDVPESAYQAAVDRYQNLGDWLQDPDKAKSAQYSPEVYPQGSFRLGTAIKPLKDEDYDLDLHCCLTAGIQKRTHSQKQLKDILGDDMEAYRKERRIQEELDEKHRCWRLIYKDQVSFHLDVVPSIPETQDQQLLLEDAMVKLGSANRSLAAGVSKLTASITDNRKPDYDRISRDWLVSNPEGYALWFESRMQTAKLLLEERAVQEKVASVGELPTYKWKSPLQRVVQILKRHRDVMFQDNFDVKPVSVLITTLAASAYQGEVHLHDALRGIISRMRGLVRAERPRVPNPVLPAEDFADKWYTDEGRKLMLEGNFWAWLTQVEKDMGFIDGQHSLRAVRERMVKAFMVPLSIPSDETTPVQPRSTVIQNAPRPWQQY